MKAATCVLGPLTILLAMSGVKAEPRILLRVDLRPYDYVVTGSNVRVMDYSSLTFLSEDLLIVAINQKVPRNIYVLAHGRADDPPSTLLGISLSSGRVSAAAKFPIEKSLDSLKALAGERFAILNAAGLQICDSTLACEAGIPATPPLRVSPMGNVIAVGGYARTPVKIVDAVKIKQLSIYDNPVPIGLQTVNPGDKAVLVTNGGQVAVRGLDGALISSFPDPRASRGVSFLDLSHRGFLSFHSQRAFVSELNGKRQLEYSIADANSTHFLTCLAGRRFGIYEHGYTRLNSLLNLLDVEKTRQEDFERVRIIEIASGMEKALIEWDPLSRSTEPALSPSASKLARIRGGYLEVVSVD